MKYLVFGLSANFAAMGELAGYERRGTLEWPGRSALIGLMGAALGIDRSGDFSKLDALNIAVAIFNTGTHLRDYHTVQSVPNAAAKCPNSRPEALRMGREKLQTSITLRDYRVGVTYGIAVTGDDLESIASALNAPHYTLYLGRKCCTLSAPPAAKVVEADSFEDAIAQMTCPVWMMEMTAKRLVIAAETNDAEVHLIHDDPKDRQKRHFAARSVAIRQVSINVAAQ